MIRSLLILCVLAGCPSSKSARPPMAGESPPTSRDPGAVQDKQQLQPSIAPPENASHQHGSSSLRADGQACLVETECASGVCEGQGCGDAVPGTCAPRTRACTKDLRPYCDCDGNTFRTSGTCPGRRYASKGECTPS